MTIGPSGRMRCAPGILRALAWNLTGGGRQGASTLAQQYVANVLNESLVSADKGDRIVLVLANAVAAFADDGKY